MNTSVELKVDGMTCQGCVRSVTKKLSGVAGVSSASVDLGAGKARVEYDDSAAKVGDLIAAVEQIGFHAKTIGPQMNADEPG
jgi:copper chaperone CopZ